MPLAAAAAALLCLATACQADEAPARDDANPRPELGLMGTIPIYWGEAGDFGELLSGNGASHWARERLEADYVLRPLDELSDETLAELDYLLLAQPRALSPAENVALDRWVRRGGRLLLFADPMLTGESRFAIGDRRRPQDVILLSPILGHWGLALEFDENQPAGYALLKGAEAAIPVNLPGAFELGEGEADCALVVADVLAQCAIGAGRALVLADAAVLDLQAAHTGAATALNWLTNEAFGENAGSAAISSRAIQ